MLFVVYFKAEICRVDRAPTLKRLQWINVDFDCFIVDFDCRLPTILKAMVFHDT